MQVTQLWLFLIVILSSLYDRRTGGSLVVERQMEDVVKFISDVQQFLSNKDTSRSRSLLTDHVPCANDQIRGFLGSCRNVISIGDRRKQSAIHGLKALLAKKKLKQKAPFMRKPAVSTKLPVTVTEYSTTATTSHDTDINLSTLHLSPTTTETIFKEYGDNLQKKNISNSIIPSTDLPTSTEIFLSSTEISQTSQPSSISLTVDETLSSVPVTVSVTDFPLTIPSPPPVDESQNQIVRGQSNIELDDVEEDVPSENEPEALSPILDFIYKVAESIFPSTHKDGDVTELVSKTNNDTPVIVPNDIDDIKTATGVSTENAVVEIRQSNSTSLPKNSNNKKSKESQTNLLQDFDSMEMSLVKTMSNDTIDPEYDPTNNGGIESLEPSLQADVYVSLPYDEEPEENTEAEYVTVSYISDYNNNDSRDDSDSFSFEDTTDSNVKISEL